MGVDGVYSRTGAYEDVVEALGRFITRMRPDGAEVFRFPPVVSRALIEKSGYLKSFPHLLGLRVRARRRRSAHRGGGRSVRSRRRSWTDDVEASELVLAPAACYPIYPHRRRARHAAAPRARVRRRGRLLPPRAFARNRPPAIVPHARVRRHRRARAIVRLPRTMDSARAARSPARSACPPDRSASDPFFGRAGAMVGRYPGAQALKFEMVIPVRSAEKPTACMSFNYHRDHFGLTWDIATRRGRTRPHRLRRLRHGPPRASRCSRRMGSTPPNGPPRSEAR